MKHAQQQTIRSPSSPELYLDDYWDGILPVDPGAIARAAGVAVIADPALLAEGLSGKYAVESGHPTIRYNPNESRVRQRFTIAHELGHHALGHPESYRDPAANFSSLSYDPAEAAANRFAAQLLMPREILLFKIGEMRSPRLAELAEAFDVSQFAMQYRLKRLGLLRG